MIERITILGGSSVYIPEFILSVIARNVNIGEIVLYGRPGAKLDTVGAFCQRIVRKSGYPGAVSTSADFDEAVSGARYVVNHIRVGGMLARARDETLPVKAGMIGDDTIGAGGIACALRTLPVVLDFAKRLETINPEAHFINLTNPQGTVVEALGRLSGLKVVGPCDAPASMLNKVAELLACAPQDLRMDYFGMNHLGWIQDIKLHGRSHMLEVLEHIERADDDGFDKVLIDLFRMIPINKVWMYFHRDRLLKKQQSSHRSRGQTLRAAEKQILRLYQDKSLSELPELTRQRNAVWYDQTIVPLIQAFESKQDRELILCVRNDGAVRDLPEECSVEAPVKVGKRGIRPQKVGSMPRFLRGLYYMIKESDRLVVEAVSHKSYEHALQALCVNPFVPSIDTARSFLDQVMKEESLELH